MIKNAKQKGNYFLLIKFHYIQLKLKQIITESNYNFLQISLNTILKSPCLLENDPCSSTDLLINIVNFIGRRIFVRKSYLLIIKLDTK